MTPALILMLIGAAAEFAAVVLLARNKGFQTLPIFCAFLIWSVLSDLGMYLVSQKFPPASDRYYFFYVRETVIDSILQFAVLVELSWSVLRPVRSSLPTCSSLGSYGPDRNRRADHLAFSQQNGTAQRWPPERLGFPHRNHLLDTARGLLHRDGEFQPTPVNWLA